MNVFNIKDFGARTCDALQTLPIQSAIDACFLAGGGRVVVPCGVYITGSFRLRSNVELYLETGAIIRGKPAWQSILPLSLRGAQAPWQSFV